MTVTIYVLSIDIFDSDLSWNRCNRYKHFNSILDSTVGLFALNAFFFQLLGEEGCKT